MGLFLRAVLLYARHKNARQQPKKKSWQNRNKIGKNDLISRRTAEPGSKTHWQPDIGVEVEVGTE